MEKRPNTRERHIYYLTQRPFGPGCLPMSGSGLVECTHQYDERTYIPEIGKQAYARLEYCKKLTDEQVADYEMAYSPSEFSILEW
jgi:hypothetical protein